MLVERGARLVERKGLRCFHSLSVQPAAPNVSIEMRRGGASYRAGEMTTRERRPQQPTDFRGVGLRSGCERLEHRAVSRDDGADVITRHVERQLIPTNSRFPQPR